MDTYSNDQSFRYSFFESILSYSIKKPFHVSNRRNRCIKIDVSNRRKRNEDKKSWIFTFFPYSSESKICIFWLKLEGQTAVDSGF